MVDTNQYYERVRKIEKLSTKYNVKGFNSLLKVFRSSLILKAMSLKIICFLEVSYQLLKT